MHISSSSPASAASRFGGYPGYLLLVIGFASVIFHTTGSLTWNTNSDQLTVPSILEDLLHNPTGLDGWQFSRAPYLFPDLFLYGAFKVLVGGLWLPMLFTVLALNCVLFVAVTELTRRVVTGPLHAGVLFGLLIGLPALASLSPDLVIHAFVYQFSFANHFSAVIGSLTLVAISLAHDEKRLFLRLIVVFVLAFLMTLSDRIIYVYLIAPWLIALAVLAWLGTRSNRVNRLSFAATCAGAFAAMSVEPYVHQQPALPMSISAALRNPVAIVADFLAVASHSLAISLLFLGLVTSIVVGAYRTMRSARPAGSAAKEDVHAWSLTFVRVFLLSGAIVSVASLVLVYDQVGGWRYWRYLMPFIYYPIVFWSIGPHGHLANGGGEQVRHARWQMAFVSMLAALAMVTTVQRRLEAFPGKVNAGLVRDYESCRAAHGLHAGLGSYWFSRKINMLSDGVGMVNQLTPWSAKVFYWGSNANWFGADFYGRPLVYDFILVNGLPVEDVRASFGPPDEQVACGELNAWIYRDPERLWSRVEPSVFSLLVRRLESGKGIDVPLSVFSASVGESDASGRSFRGEKDREGYLMFGPYWNIEKGTYRFKISYTYRADSQHPGIAKWDFAYDNGQRILSEAPFTKVGEHVSEYLPLVLERSRDGFELRVYVKDVPYFSVHAIELTKGS